MNRISKMSICLALCAVMLVALIPAAPACQVGEFYLTKERGIAAATNETLAEASSYAETGISDRLSVLIKSGRALKLEEDEKVQVLERSLDWKTLKIKFTSGRGPYWVKEESLKRIESQ